MFLGLLPRRDARRLTLATLFWTLAAACNAASEPPSTPKMPEGSGHDGSLGERADAVNKTSPASGLALPQAGASAAGVAVADKSQPPSAAGAAGSGADKASCSNASAGTNAGKMSCSGADTPAGTGADTPAGTGAEAAPPTAAGADFREIIASDWQLAPGDETYLCLRKTADADLRVNQFRTDLPPGTHHLGLYVSPTPDQTDGMTDCNLLETGERLIVGAGPGSAALSMPSGVAMRFDQGNQLLMQLHLLNPTDAPLQGRSVVLGVTLPEQDVKVEAQVIAAQLLTLTVPRGPSRAQGRCTFDRAQTLFAFGAHMHETGRHAKLVLHRAEHGDQVLRDGGFDFSEQRRYPLDLLEVAAGDYVDYECSYENTTDRTIYWGESSSDEMCLFNLYRFPAGGETLCLL